MATRLKRRGFLGILGAAAAAPVVALSADEQRAHIEAVFKPAREFLPPTPYEVQQIYLLTSEPVAPSDVEERDSSGRWRENRLVPSPAMRMMRIDVGQYAELDRRGLPRTELLCRVAAYDAPSNRIDVIPENKWTPYEETLATAARDVLTPLLGPVLRADRARTDPRQTLTVDQIPSHRI